MIIKEFEYLQYKDINDKNYIKPETFEALEKFVLDNETTQYLKITTKKGYGKVLQAQKFVGVIQTKDGTTIEILPKVKNVDEQKSKDILLKMLKTLKKSPFKNLNTANLKTYKMPLLEIFITMFVEELARLVQKGIKSDYITKEENLKFLKGKLKINEQIKYNYIHKERFFVQYQEFVSDRVENRLIKTTLQYLYKKSKLNKNQQRIREFLFVFDDVGISHNIKTDFEKIKLNRQMKDYELVLLWCKTFLLDNSFSPYKGNTIAFALLFDMNLLFESYVGRYLKKKGFDVSLQDKGKYLVDSHQKFALRPDIVINWKESIIIVDTKWKNITEEKDISQSDMYQLYAYGKKYKNNQLYLIYPRLDQKQPKLKYTYCQEAQSKLNLRVVYFDLEKR
ncbi:McrC family protein [Arcobacter sp. FWKO B]|uniref:McrC family protein n=1 Tax=Arcobacter sp. FWKO B TaxID=2593672 RepID=UPI0019072F62|nr:McrC family protein [Arcobacter sp. FWKO B]